MCTNIAVFDVRLLKVAPLFQTLLLAFWFRIRVGDIQAATSTIKLSSVQCAFSLRICYAKTDSKAQFLNHPIFFIVIFKVQNKKTKLCLLMSQLWQINSCLFPASTIYFISWVFVSLILWKFLVGDRLRTLVVHRNRDYNELFHIKTKS